MKPRVGIPIAFDAEAWCLLGARRWGRSGGREVRMTPLTPGADILALRSGVGAKNGLRAARWLIGQGAEALVSIGVAGGLHPEVKAGDLILGDRIMEEGAGQEREEWESDPVCTNLTHSVLLTQGISARRGAILSVRSPVLTSSGKSELYGRTHALVSDMESASIARGAAESHLPFLALRAAVDPPQENLDPALSGCLDENGQVCFQMLWRNLCRRPSLTPRLLRMARELFIALSVLRRCWPPLVRHTLPALLGPRNSLG